MRPVFSGKNSELVAQVTEKVGLWDNAPLTIGLDAARCLAIKSANTAAGAAQADMIAKRTLAEAATQLFNDECRTVRELTGNAIRSIDNYARITNDPKVWTLAGISPPKDPSTAQPPAQPLNMTAGIDSEGQLTIKWKCSNPRGVSGVIYQIKRRINNTGPFTLLETVGEKTFVDDTIIAGTRAVTYIVQGKRGQQTGAASAQFTVQFGVDGPGLSIADQFSGEGVAKLAA